MYLLVIKNIKDIIKNKKRMSLLTLLPLTFFLLIVVLFTDVSIGKKIIQPLKIGIIDKDQSFFSKLLIQNYKENTVFLDFMDLSVDDEITITKKYKENQLDAIIYIPKDFAEKMMHMEHEPITVTIDTNNFTKAIIMKNILKSYEKYIATVEYNISALYDVMTKNDFNEKDIKDKNLQLSYKLIMTAMNRSHFFDFKEITQIPNTTSFNYFFISLSSLLIMYFGLYVGLDIVRERELGTYQRLQVIGYKTYKFIVAKLIGHLLFLYSILLLWFALGGAVFQYKINIFMVVFLLFITIFSVSFSILISSLFRSQETILLVGNIYYFISAIIGGNVIPIQFLPDNIQKISALTPNYWIIKGFLLVQKNIDKLSIYLITSSFTILSILFIIISICSYGFLREVHNN